MECYSDVQTSSVFFCFLLLSFGQTGFCTQARGRHGAVIYVDSVPNFAYTHFPWKSMLGFGRRDSLCSNKVTLLCEHDVKFIIPGTVGIQESKGTHSSSFQRTHTLVYIQRDRHMISKFHKMC